MPNSSLRPIERRVLQLAADGVEDDEIGRRFKRSPEWAGRVRIMAEMPRGSRHLQGDVLRPLERRVLRWRATGVDLDTLAPRFRKTPDFLRQVESLAHYKLRPPS